MDSRLLLKNSEASTLKAPAWASAQMAYRALLTVTFLSVSWRWCSR